MRITREGGRRWPGVWSPDGRSVVMVVNIGGAFDGPFRLARISASGTGDEETLASVAPNPWPAGWLPEGKSLVFWAEGQSADAPRNAGASGFFVLPLDGDRTPQLVQAMGRGGGVGVLSPDGRWMAYSSRDTGQPEVYVQPWPTGGERWTVSTSGGGDHDGARTGASCSIALAADCWPAR